MSLVGYIFCGLLVLVLCEGLSGWGQGLGRCWRSGFSVPLTVSWLVAGVKVALYIGMVCVSLRLGRCWRSGWSCNSGFNVGLRQDGVGYTPTVSWLVAEGSLGLRLGGIGRALSVCFLLVM